MFITKKKKKKRTLKYRRHQKCQIFDIKDFDGISRWYFKVRTSLSEPNHYGSESRWPLRKLWKTIPHTEHYIGCNIGSCLPTVGMIWGANTLKILL